MCGHDRRNARKGVGNAGCIAYGAPLSCLRDVLIPGETQPLVGAPATQRQGGTEGHAGGNARGMTGSVLKWPAAAVIPAPIAYIKVVAVKKLVVGFQGRWCGPPKGEHRKPRVPLPEDCVCP